MICQLRKKCNGRKTRVSIEALKAATERERDTGMKQLAWSMMLVVAIAACARKEEHSYPAPSEAPTEPIAAAPGESAPDAESDEGDAPATGPGPSATSVGVSCSQFANPVAVG